MAYKITSIHCLFQKCLTHLDAIFGPLLQVRYYGMVPEINEPGSKLLYCHRTGQEETRAYTPTEEQHSCYLLSGPEQQKKQNNLD